MSVLSAVARTSKAISLEDTCSVEESEGNPFFAYAHETKMGPERAETRRHTVLLESLSSFTEPLLTSPFRVRAPLDPARFRPVGAAAARRTGRRTRPVRCSIPSAGSGRAWVSLRKRLPLKGTTVDGQNPALL